MTLSSYGVCPYSNAPTPETTTEEIAESEERSETEKPLEQSDGGNVLAAYFSNSGNTEETAQVIADKTGADLAEIRRAQEYGIAEGLTANDQAHIDTWLKELGLI